MSSALEGLSAASEGLVMVLRRVMNVALHYGFSQSCGDVDTLKAAPYGAFYHISQKAPDYADEFADADL